MNENSQPKMPTFDSWLDEATATLKSAGIESARLDAELILAHTLRQPRTYLHAHGDDTLSSKHADIAGARLQLRLNRTPIAYIIGHKEFYGRRFKTTPSALIPRPESETIISELAKILPENASSLRLIDIGTGTGCLGITAKLEWPALDVTLIDNSVHALNLAKENAELFHADVRCMKNDLLRGYGMPVDIVIANLPYVDDIWEVSPETSAEPPEALYSANNGLSHIYRLLDQAAPLLRPGGYILLESDPRQRSEIIERASNHGFVHKATEGYVTVFSRS